MPHKFEYKTQEERQQIFDNNQDKIWVEERNVTEGNFLIFVDTVEEANNYIP